jgi:TPR repeat protein
MKKAGAFAFFIHKSKIRATTAKIQITKACDLNSGGGCSFLGLMYGKGKGVKQDDFKAVKFLVAIVHSKPPLLSIS